jgi:hypothetical protein
MSAVTKSNGQGAPHSRTSAMATSASVIQRLQQQSISGRNLDVWVHQHFGYMMHYIWKGAFGSRCFERRFGSYHVVVDFCRDIVNGTPERLADCMLLRDDYQVFNGTMRDLLLTKTAFCVPPRVFPYTEWGTESRWYTIAREREWQEDGKGFEIILYPISSSEAIQ